MSWIKVEHSLPENEDPVIVYTKNGRRLIGAYLPDMQKWFDYEAHKRNENQLSPFRFDPVTHWLPLPEPPNDNDEESASV
jgi:hypothetical protein